MIKPRDNQLSNEILYYCKDCQKIVNAQKVGRKFVFRCPICKTKNVAFGTEKSLKNFFHIEDEKEKVEKKSDNGLKKDTSEQ